MPPVEKTQDVVQDPQVAAALTPSKTFSRTYKEKMNAWLNEDEPAAEPVEPDSKQAPEPEEPEEKEPEQPFAEATEEIEAEAEVEVEEDLAAEAEASLEAAEDKPTPEEGGEAERKPKSYSVKDGEEEFDVPETVQITYRADGHERTRPLDEVIKFAQMGENFDRRSTELAQDRRDSEETFKQRYEQLEGQYRQAQHQLMQTVQRLGTDPDYRQEFIDEFERLSSDPEELQLRLKAQRAAELERWVQERMSQDQQAYSQRIWNTVNSLIHAGLKDYSEDLRERTAERVRDRFHKKYQAEGKAAISDRVVRGLVAEERSVIDAAVEAARRDALKDIEPQIQRARLEATVETKNKITDQAIKQDKVGRAAPKPSAGAPAAERKTKVTSVKDVSKALKEWAAS